MPSRRSRPRRLLLPTLLAVVLAAEISGLALARSLTPTVHVNEPAPTPPQAAAVVAHRSPVADQKAGPGNVSREAGSIVVSPARTRPLGAVVGPPAQMPASVASSTREVTAKPAETTGTARSTPTYRGRNHVWIPSLGINRSVSSFPCSRSRPPDNYLYRWGCAGRNNVYLLGHSYSVFKPLHAAYVGGRLKKGMKVIYADGSGQVGTYSVIWWKVVAPTTAASWAWAAQSRPSMTLQTCVGSKSQYRLMVRLVKVG